MHKTYIEAKQAKTKTDRWENTQVVFLGNKYNAEHSQPRPKVQNKQI
jgi:hypothetical protein